ncbi:MAG: hypothetical protein LBG22_02390 [Treponema sp.]|jgi:L-fucose isomerase-like protein|nr:hypothetical protein [Treponema sp.]
MFREDKIVLGYIPIRRDFFPQPAAQAVRDQIRPRIEQIVSKLYNVEMVNIDWLKNDKDPNDWGLAWDYSDVPKIVDYMKGKKIDAVFMPHCNFGQEEVVGQLGRDLGVPILIWGPRDPRPGANGEFRPLDTQCGMFASTKALYRYNVPYTYIENCWLDSPVLDKGIEDFVRTAAVVKAFRNMRVAQFGLRPRPFLSIKINEADLMQQLGIEIVPIWLDEVSTLVKRLKAGKVDPVSSKDPRHPLNPLENSGSPDPRIGQIMQDIKNCLDCSTQTDDQLATIAALKTAILEISRAQGCSAVAVECWSDFRHEFDIGSCFLLADINDAGLVAACETDIHAAITARMLQAAARSQTASFIADLTIRHPDNDNAELLWHCGPFAKSLKREGANGAVREFKGQYEIKHGPITIARLEQDAGNNYMLFADEGKGVDGPPTNGTYVWFETNDWSKWEKHLMYNPYIHHVAGIHGNYAQILKEACKYIGRIKYDSVNQY